MLRILFILLLGSCSAQAQVNLNQGLQAYYPFNGEARDLSGNNNHPVFNNAGFISDRFGRKNHA
ncbi:MAG TPA: hypothetical protein PLT49_09000, partial [Ferruginibacter sp.]|nr:hypothetical protein [Ferruginibacter sp.]